MSREELLETLPQFTGTTQWFHHPNFPQFQYTDGIRFLARNADCYWLLEHIFLHQSDEKIRKEPFQVWKITLQEKGGAVITIDDGNGKVIKTFKIPLTDFPLQEFEIWFSNGVLLLKSEY